ncbi:Hypothetical protein, putative [Bodo saltans]|uniref:Uncharacterized protein n=1 Tax=Bodo saltans TaxID=75058 RepID=A0A0S4J2G3_BODSA|nr:Hypothetical protein, putative [Bodo saltans]|eukprot:CUG63119.1 Hypothetical protein, putative [Bodo saltans]
MLRDLTNQYLTRNDTGAEKRVAKHHALVPKIEQGNLRDQSSHERSSYSRSSPSRHTTSRHPATSAVVSTNVGAYLSRVIDVQQSGRVHPQDVVRFIEALQVLPTAADGGDGVSDGIMDRAVIQMLLEQVFRSAERLQQHMNVDDRSTASVSTYEGGMDASVSSSVALGSQRSSATVSIDTCALVFNRVLPSTTVALAERLEQLEQLAGTGEDREAILHSIHVLQTDIDNAEASIGRYEVLIGQCQKALEARRVAAHPLTVMVHAKLSHQEAAETVLQEKRLAEGSMRADLDASQQLVTLRAEEVEGWRARMVEWKHEMRTVGEDLEATKAEEEILLKRLDSLRQHRRSLELQLDAVDEGVKSCQESLDRALETWQDAVGIAAAASAHHQTSIGDVDDAKAVIMTIERGIDVARGEFSAEKIEAESILQRYHLLCAERRKLRETLVKDTLDVAALKNTLASIVEHSPRRLPISMPHKNESVVSVLIDELRGATELLEGLIEL